MVWPAQVREVVEESAPPGFAKRLRLARVFLVLRIWKERWRGEI